MAEPSRLVCIVGPTGTGKTAAALALSRLFPCTVVNMDSRQIYRDFPLITAQPSAAEQAVCPHTLYGFLPTEAKISAGEYVRMAERAVGEISAAGRRPVFVGGTGLYGKAFFEGMAAIPAVAAEVAAAVQARCVAEGSPALYEELQGVDPEYAVKIHPHDRQRITRALEVWQATGKTFSWWHKQGVPACPHQPLYIGIGLPLAELEPILARRIDLMVEQGAVEEAQRARAICDDPAAPGWSGIGCRELYAYLAGDFSFEDCKALWLKNTRAYAKRQWTWFQGNAQVRWFTPGREGEIADYVAEALHLR